MKFTFFLFVLYFVSFNAMAKTVDKSRQLGIAWVAGHLNKTSESVEEKAKITFEYIMDGYDDFQPIQYKFEMNDKFCSTTVDPEKLLVLEGSCRFKKRNVPPLTNTSCYPPETARNVVKALLAFGNAPAIKQICGDSVGNDAESTVTVVPQYFNSTEDVYQVLVRNFDCHVLNISLQSEKRTVTSCN